MPDFSDFAVETARTIAREEGNLMVAEMAEDCRALVSKWANQLGDRVMRRLDAVGFAVEFEVKADWNPTSPTFTVIGSTLIEGDIDGEHN